LERGNAVLTEFGDELRIETGDAMFLCGAPDALDACLGEFPQLRPRPSTPDGSAAA